MVVIVTVICQLMTGLSAQIFSQRLFLRVFLNEINI